MLRAAQRFGFAAGCSPAITLFASRWCSCAVYEDAAKNRQGILRARIGQMSERLRELSTYSFARIPKDKISYGSRVKLSDVDSGEEIEYQLVFPEEVDAAAGLVSINAPIGQALMNKTPGDEVTVQTPRGRKTYEIMDLSTLHDRMPEPESTPGE